MTIQEFVSLQLIYGGDPVRFDVHHDGEVEAYTVENADALGGRELAGWELDRSTGRMQLHAADGVRVDLVSAELPAGAEL